jgi:solute carrier family 31 (copper transporter), member 1
MDHGGGNDGMGAECKISVSSLLGLFPPSLSLNSLQMLWNWYTVDACFLSSSWHITNDAMFAATCIGVILLVVLVEFCRRMGKEYDAFIIRQFHRRAAIYSPALAASGCAGATEMVSHSITFRASLLQQAIRAVLHAVTFGGAYIIMLLAMYFNGYIIISIFLGAGLGKFLCDWLVVKVDIGLAEAADGSKPKGIEETTVCCG